MDDLISRAAALDAIDGMKPMQGNMEQLAMKALCWAAVKTIQPVDAVPVVRCKDCGYFQANNAEEVDWSGRCTNVYVPMNGMTVDGWWFCADGKREG